MAVNTIKMQTAENVSPTWYCSACKIPVDSWLVHNLFRISEKDRLSYCPKCGARLVYAETGPLDSIQTAVRALGYHNKKVSIETINYTHYNVYLDQKPFGVFDIKKNTFVD